MLRFQINTFSLMYGIILPKLFHHHSLNIVLSTLVHVCFELSRKKIMKLLHVLPFLYMNYFGTFVHIVGRIASGLHLRQTSNLP